MFSSAYKFSPYSLFIITTLQQQSVAISTDDTRFQSSHLAISATSHLDTQRKNLYKDVELSLQPQSRVQINKIDCVGIDDLLKTSPTQ